MKLRRKFAFLRNVLLFAFNFNRTQQKSTLSEKLNFSPESIYCRKSFQNCSDRTMHKISKQNYYFSLKRILFSPLRMINLDWDLLFALSWEI